MKRIFLLLIAVLWSIGSLLNAQELVRAKDPRTGLYGYKYENSKKWVVKPKYYQAGYFHEGLAYVIKKKGRHEKSSPKYFAGYIDQTGKIVIPLQFEWANDFHEGIAAVKIWDDTSIFHWRYGYIDTAGNFVIPPIYDYVEDYKNGKAKVKWYDEYGYCHGAYIDLQGNAVHEWQEGGRLPEGQTRPRWR